MKGVIAYINDSRGMVAVATEAGDFSIFELMGGETIVNETQGERFEVYFQNHHVGRHQLRQQLFYP